MPTKKAAKTAATPSTSLVQQGAKFGLVGISNTIIDYTLYITITGLLRVPLDSVYLVKFFSGTVAMINSFIWNRKWVFKSQTSVGSSGIKFLTATLVSVYLIQPNMVRLFSATDFGQSFGSFWFHLAQTIGIAGLAPNLFTEAFIIKTAAFGMGVIGSAIWNFTMYKLWAFKETK